MGSLFDEAFDEATVSWKLIGDDWTPRTLNEQGGPLRDMQEHLIEITSRRR